MIKWPELLVILISIPISILIGGLIECAEKLADSLLFTRRPVYFFRPFSDVYAALRRTGSELNRSQLLTAAAYLSFNAVACAVLFLKDDLMFAVFAFLIGSACLIGGSWSLNSPFSRYGARNETIKFLVYAPILALTAICIRMATGSFLLMSVFTFNSPLIYNLPLVFIAAITLVAIKTSKSPFNFSGDATIEYNGSQSGLVSIGRWLERTFLYGIIVLFLATSVFGSAVLAFVVFLIWSVSNRFTGNIGPGTFLKWGSLTALLLIGINLLWILLGGGFA